MSAGLGAVEKVAGLGDAAADEKARTPATGLTAVSARTVAMGAAEKHAVAMGAAGHDTTGSTELRARDETARSGWAREADEANDLPVE
jgi:hypothetical protein